MNIHEAFTLDRDGKTYYIHSGTCDGRLTKWITLSPWDGEQVVVSAKGYADATGQHMMIWESDEDEYYDWCLPPVRNSLHTARASRQSGSLEDI